MTIKQQIKQLKIRLAKLLAREWKNHRRAVETAIADVADSDAELKDFFLSLVTGNWTPETKAIWTRAGHTPEVITAIEQARRFKAKCIDTLPENDLRLVLRFLR